MPGPLPTPDVVLILTDQWNPRMMGCYGDSTVRTPHLDQLAREGVRFDNAYASSPVCMPARCSLVSGQFPHRHGFWNNFTGLKFPVDRVTLFHVLREQGYTTAKIGKYHLFNPEAGEDHRDHGDYYDALGLDWAQELPTSYMGPYLRNEYTRFLEEKGMLQPYIDDIAERFVGGDHHVVRPSPLAPDEHIDGYVARQAERYIEACTRERPMFLCVSFPGPHTPFDAPRPYSDMYDPEAMTLAPNVPATTSQGHDHVHIRRMQANYFGKLTHLDDRVGALLQALDRRGNLANTLVLFAADHGEYLGSHGRHGKGDFHEESARIPLLMHWPERIRPHQTCAAPVSWLDLYATVLHAAGRDDHSTPSRESLLPLATSACEPMREAVFSEIGNRQGFNFMVRAGDHKWFLTNGKESLFHLPRDPYEQHNLAEEAGTSGLCLDMRERLLQFLMSDQENHAAGYLPLFQRMGLQVSGQEDAYAFLRSRFSRIHGLEP
ncbi:MAG: sulfatase-like hydrolase/transferase [Caldilineaceae bacterium SB0666_bin_21]|nr:sulfatase-like hydrolase/transferase [Caldilineaceae bacterium SB0666_bin_21]